MESKVIGLWFNAKDHFNALTLTVLTLFSATGLIEDSSHHSHKKQIVWKHGLS